MSSGVIKVVVVILPDIAHQKEKTRLSYYNVKTRLIDLVDKQFFGAQQIWAEIFFDPK